MNTRWWLPLLVLLGAAPLWLHWWEPALFLSINQACASVNTPEATRAEYSPSE